VTPHVLGRKGLHSGFGMKVDLTVPPAADVQDITPK